MSKPSKVFFECSGYFFLMLITRCSDTSTQYYDGSRCVPQRTFGEFCDDDNPCYTDNDLECDSNLCG